jgi:hypothetical protein
MRDVKAERSGLESEEFSLLQNNQIPFSASAIIRHHCLRFIFNLRLRAFLLKKGGARLMKVKMPVL